MSMPPPNEDAELLERVELEMLRIAPLMFSIAPPNDDAELFEIVELEMVAKPPKWEMPPPWMLAVLPETLE